MSDFHHVSVLMAETLEALAPSAGCTYVDATLGGAGHANAILEACAPDGQLIGLDQDPAAIAVATERLGAFEGRVRIAHAAFEDLPSVLEELGVDRVHGVLADVGVSSPQLDEAGRGFSIQRSGPLDMRMNPTRGESAQELIARLDADALANVIYEYGEERKSRRIARSIKYAEENGDLNNTAELRTAVHKAVGPRSGRVDSATRTFQALRIAVNRELDQLEALTKSLPDVLHDDGVAVIISFHSLEDRIVKWAFKDDPNMVPLTKKPVMATDEERDQNPRARTAKLRAARRVPRREMTGGSR